MNHYLLLTLSVIAQSAILWRLRQKKLQWLKTTVVCYLTTDIFFTASQHFLTPRVYGVLWCISMYLIITMVAYISSKVAGSITPEMNNPLTMIIPPTMCLVFAIMSWPPTKQMFYRTVFRCVMVCIGTLSSAILWRMKNSITPLVLGFSALLVAVGISALRVGQFWDGAWFVGFLTIALVLKRPPPANHYGGY